MTANLDRSLTRLRQTFGATVGRAVVHDGVVAVATAVPFTPANLAALEAAWRFDVEPRADETRQ